MAQTVSPANKHERDARAIHTRKIQQRRCIYCGQVASLVWVHGHGQCAACGINVDECCRGESCFKNEG